MAEASTHRRPHLSCLFKKVPQSPISIPVHPDPTFQDTSSQLRRISIIRTSLRSTIMIRATSAYRLLVFSSSRTVHMPHTTTQLINHFRPSFPLRIQVTTPPTGINHAWIPDLPWINLDRITFFFQHSSAPHQNSSNGSNPNTSLRQSTSSTTTGAGARPSDSALAIAALYASGNSSGLSGPEAQQRMNIACATSANQQREYIVLNDWSAEKII